MAERLRCAPSKAEYETQKQKDQCHDRDLVKSTHWLCPDYLLIRQWQHSMIRCV